MSEPISILDKRFKPYISKEEVQEIVSRMAEKINHDYAGKNPLFLAILNGSFMFTADLFKKLTIPCTVSFVKLASYRGTRSTGNVLTLIGLDEDISERHIVILEDIVDTGKTLSELLPSLEKRNPRSLEVCTLLLKPEALNHPISLKYVGKEIPNAFIVGYGLDYDGQGRNLPEVYQITD